MKTGSYIYGLLISTLLTACSSKHTANPNSTQSYEIVNADTVNRTDFSNRKQGKWYTYQHLPEGRRVTDTLFYKDGVLLNQ